MLPPQAPPSETFFSDEEVPIVEDREEAGRLLRALVNSPQLRDRMVHRAQRQIWVSHTYAHRANTILEFAGITHAKLAFPEVTAGISTNRPEQLEHVLGQMAHQRGVSLNIILLTHGFQISASHLNTLVSKVGLSPDRLTILHKPASEPLGSCLNSIIDETDTEAFAKIDDDDYYGPYYLLDQLNALNYSGASIVGKEAAYVYLNTSSQLVLCRPDREHHYTHFIAGPTMVGKTSIFQRYKFSNLTRGEDTDFLSRVVDDQVPIYSADRFNFIQVRGRSKHTWDTTDSSFLANGVVESFGLNLKHVNVD